MKQNRYEYYILVFLFLLHLYKSKIISGTILFLIACIIWFVFFIFSLSKVGLGYTLLKLVIYSIPISFVNIFGESYSYLPVSWFNIFYVLLLFYTLLSLLFAKKIKINPLVIFSLIFLGCSIVPFLASSNFVDGSKQFINIIIFSSSFLIGTILKKPSERDIIIFKDAYLNSVKAAAICLLIQFITFIKLNTISGNIMFLGGSRRAFGFLFSDFSFLSLYYASGLAMIISSYNTCKKENIILSSLLLLSASILTSARTGLFAFAIAMLVIIFYRAVKGSLKACFQLLLFPLILLVLIKLFSFVRPLDVFSDSGRLQGYIVGIKYFIKSPFFGIGLGVRSYKQITGSTIPHNLIIQYLSQAGMIATLFLILLLLSLVKLAINIKSKFLLPLLTVLIGGLSIPDIINSRYLCILVIFVLIEWKFRNSHKLLGGS